MIGQDDLQGHWQRDWIKAPGFEDHTTRVHWLQAGVLFADLRIPAHRPDTSGRNSLADLAAAELRLLLDAEGFAGHTTVEDSRCTWHREINWHGAPEQADIGLMSFDPEGGLIEDGVLSEYRELWQAVPQSTLRGTKIRCGEMCGILIESDTVFLLAVGPDPRGTREALITALDNGNVDQTALDGHFSSAYVLGRWDGAQGIGTLGTNPFYEDQVVVERGEPSVWYSIAFDGTRTAMPLLSV